MDHTLALIGRIHQGDKEARDTLFSENMGLVHSVARRFLGRGVEMEDLFQIGSIGLLKAVDHFNPEFDVKFSTYAVPMIIGEIKRFLMDDGILKVSRSIKENQYKICKMREELEKKLGREPDLRELSDAMNMPMGRIGDDAGIGCRGGFYLQDCVSGRWNGFAACGQASGKRGSAMKSF